MRRREINLLRRDFRCRGRGERLAMRTKKVIMSSFLRDLNPLRFKVED